MDPRNYYHKVRETLKSMTDEFFVVVSEETADGGKAGVTTEVSRRQAAKLLVEDRARLATPEEAELFHIENEQKRKDAKALLEASQFQLIAMADKVIRAVDPRRRSRVEKPKE